MARTVSFSGDGMMSAIALLNVVAESGKKLSKLADEIPEFPQVLVNVIVDNDKKADAMADADLAARRAEVEAALGDNGRVLVRASGTEPLIRIMLEGQDEKEILDLALSLAHILVNNHGGKIKV